jgi:hypothetical protein
MGLRGTEMVVPDDGDEKSYFHLRPRSSFYILSGSKVHAPVLLTWDSPASDRHIAVYLNTFIRDRPFRITGISILRSATHSSPPPMIKLQSDSQERKRVAILTT